jgi:hypothetical protein
MFITKIHGKEDVTAKAAELGLVAGESLPNGRGYGKPAIGGNTFAHKDAIKAAGGRWIAADKVWGFESWAELDAALDAINQ